MIAQSPMKATTPLKRCPTCGLFRSSLAYMRVTDLRLFLPEYHALSQDRLLKAYQQEQISLFGRLVTYDRVVNWVRTMRRDTVGIAGRDNPFRRYLAEVYPTHQGWQAHWTYYSSACDALKDFQHV